MKYDFKKIQNAYKLYLIYKDINLTYKGIQYLNILENFCAKYLRRKYNL